MASVVVPFRGSDPKQRLAMGEAARRALADAMLADVVAAAAAVGPVLVSCADRDTDPLEVAVSEILR